MMAVGMWESRGFLRDFHISIARIRLFFAMTYGPYAARASAYTVAGVR